MKSLFWLAAGGIIVALLMEHHQRATSQPLIPQIQPQGCLPGDPSITIGGITYCIPQGVVTY